MSAAASPTLDLRAQRAVVEDSLAPRGELPTEDVPRELPIEATYRDIDTGEVKVVQFTSVVMRSQGHDAVALYIADRCAGRPAQSIPGDRFARWRAIGRLMFQVKEFAKLPDSFIAAIEADDFLLHTVEEVLVDHEGRFRRRYLPPGTADTFTPRVVAALAATRAGAAPARG